MILIKLLPLWLALTLITAASRPERRRRDIFSRAHWWETAFKASRRSKQWPKRGEAAPVPTYETCVCAESVGFHDLGEGHWPQVVPSRECGFGISPISKLCRVLTEPEDGFVCKQRTYAVRVLRRRDGPVQQSAGHSRDMLPLELRDEWELVERHVNSSCELEAVIM